MPFHRFLSLYIGITVLIGWSSCASMQPLSGGDKDTTPPKVINQSPQNKTLSFNGKEIEIEFDEYIQVRDLQNQLLITPRLTEEPLVSANGKILKLQFKQPLLPNTTYNINFGNAVMDNHEGNVVSGLSVIFSTGLALDSISISGKITDAFTLKPVGDVSVFIYENATDSCMFKTKPDYMGKADKEGNYRVNYIKAGKYKIVAVGDKNKNLLYDPSSESAANLYETDLSSSLNTDFAVFSETPDRFFIKRTSHPFYGKTVFAFNRPSDTIFVQPPQSKKDRVTALFSSKNDTLAVFYKKGSEDSIAIVLTDGKSVLDTALLVTWPEENYANDFKTRKLFPHIRKIDGADTGLVNSIVFDMPLQAEWNKSKIFFVGADTFRLRENVQVVGNKVQFNGEKYSKTGKARLILLPGAVKGFNDVQNDTIVYPFEVVAKENQGTILLQMEFPDDSAYIMELINEKGQVQLALSFAARQKSGGSNKNVVKKNLQRLNPGSYSIRLIKDRDENGEWTSGNLLQKKKPEPVFYYNKPIKLLADWEINISWKVE